MKSNRTFIHMLSAIGGFLRRFKWWGSKTYADPHFGDTYHNHRSHAGTKSNRKGRKRLQAPDLKPGTITHKDWLVRELGYDRRLADGYYYAFLNGYKVKMPMPSDLVAI